MISATAELPPEKCSRPGKTRKENKGKRKRKRRATLISATDELPLVDAGVPEL
jgi:hypothetical protein